jgi:hypothetical protein
MHLEFAAVWLRQLGKIGLTTCPRGVENNKIVRRNLLDILDGS